MTYGKGILSKCLSLVLCVIFLLSCHSGNKVVSSYGKRKYTKGWFWFKHGTADSRAANYKDSIHNRKIEIKQWKDSIATAKREKKEDEKIEEKEMRQQRKDAARVAKENASQAMNKPGNPPVAQNKVAGKEKIKEPPDHTIMRLLPLILVMMAVAALVTGLITPIIIWKVTQNFLIIVGVVLTFFFLFVSVDQKLQINSSPKGPNTPYNLGKPAWTLSLWACIPIALLYTVVKTALIANLLFVNITTIGLFFSGVLVLLSICFAGKALFVNDIHKGKAVLALLLDAVLIIATVLLFI